MTSVSPGSPDVTLVLWTVDRQPTSALWGGIPPVNLVGRSKALISLHHNAAPGTALSQITWSEPASRPPWRASRGATDHVTVGGMSRGRCLHTPCCSVPMQEGTPAPTLISLQVVVVLSQAAGGELLARSALPRAPMRSHPLPPAPACYPSSFCRSMAVQMASAIAKWPRLSG